MASLLTQENAVFRAFATYSALVICKTFAVAMVTGATRFKNKAFANPEDCVRMKDRDGRRLKPFADPTVERVRRCHLNDLENVLPFVLTGLLYVTTAPNLQVALWHFRLFAASRTFHTFAYLIPLPQPSRVLSFVFGLLATLSMAFSVIRFYVAF